MTFNKQFFLFILVFSIISLSSCSKSSRDEENTLNVYSAEVVPGVDPITISDRYSHAVARQIYEGLYEYHYLKYPFTISPVLADGLPEVSKDGLTYTIKLKNGVFFSTSFNDKKRNHKILRTKKSLLY